MPFDVQRGDWPAYFVHDSELDLGKKTSLIDKRPAPRHSRSSAPQNRDVRFRAEGGEVETGLPT